MKSWLNNWPIEMCNEPRGDEKCPWENDRAGNQNMRCAGKMSSILLTYYVTSHSVYYLLTLFTVGFKYLLLSNTEYHMRTYVKIWICITSFHQFVYYFYNVYHKLCTFKNVWYTLIFLNQRTKNISNLI